MMVRFSNDKLGIVSLLFFTFFGVTLSDVPDTLRQVNLLYRHGDRSPTAIYPKDKHQLDAWPDGLGWLSNTGKMQQYELGQYIGQRYDGFLNTTYYNHSEILIQSSGVDRCLMSAYCNLAGLYQPQESQKWNPNLLWQPIPVQTSPEGTDKKLSENAPCPRYDQLKEEVLKSPEIKKEEEENKEFYDMVEEATGIKKETIDDIWQVVDTLVCEKAHNLTWNEWVTEAVWTKMLQLQAMSFDLLYAKPEMVRLKGGPLLKEIISNMQSGKIPESSFPKFYMYSAHDTTVASLLSAMDVFDKRPPIYRALVMVELHEINGEYVVKIFYRNDTSAEPSELSPSGCGSPCTLENFIEVTKDRVPGNWDKECQATVSSGSPLSPGYSCDDKFDSNFVELILETIKRASWIAMTVGVAVGAVVAVALIIMIIRLRKRRRTATYTKL